MIETKGKLIVGLGLPGSGKSSVMRRAAAICRSICFVEPEESEWPDAVRQRAQVGYATAITWFRSVRVTSLFKADDLRKNGHIVFVDSFYDKLVSKYLGRRGMEWLIPPEDPYYPVIQLMAELDYELLPEADCVVSFNISNDVWLELLKKRNRQLDADAELSKTFETQELFYNAAKLYCESNGITHILFRNGTDGVESAAKRLINQLTDEKVI